MEINIKPTKKQTISDDPELAKALMGTDDSGSSDDANDNTLQYEDLNADAGQIENLMPDISEIPQEEFTQAQEPASVEQPAMSYGGLNLEDIKNHALQDLRPLVDKLTVSNEEKFDIYLLLLRSSDDNTLIEPAYNSARLIEDETKRANALLDVIKEIDYFNSKQQ